MRESNAYTDRKPLIDALRIAGCPDDDPVLVILCDPSSSEITTERAVAIAMSQEGEDAVNWVDDLLVRAGTWQQFDYSTDAIKEERPITYEELMRVAHTRPEAKTRWDVKFVNTGTNEKHKDLPLGYEIEFWKRFQTITGKLFMDDYHGIFHCQC